MFAPFVVLKRKPIQVRVYDDMGHFMYTPFPPEEVQQLIAKQKHVKRFWFDTKTKHGHTPHWKRLPGAPEYTKYNIRVNGLLTDVTIHWDFPVAAT